MKQPAALRVFADFNGLFGDILCLSHRETCRDADGREVVVHEGMTVVAFDEDVDDDGKPDNLVASGIVDRPPEWLSCNGSRWVLRIDEKASDMNLTFATVRPFTTIKQWTLRFAPWNTGLQQRWKR